MNEQHRSYTQIKHWGIKSIPLMPSPPGQFWPRVVKWPRVVESENVLDMGKIEQTMFKELIDVELWLLYRNTSNQLWPSRLMLQITPTASQQRDKTAQTSVLDMTLIWGYSNSGALGNGEYHSLPSLPGLLWLGVVAPDRVLSIGQIKLSSVLMLNRIAWNRTIFLHFKLRTYAKLNCLKQNYFDF